MPMDKKRKVDDEDETQSNANLSWFLLNNQL